jgi:hypothetical protein
VMIGRIASLALDTLDGMRWLLPALLAGVAIVVLWIDGPRCWGRLRRGGPVPVRRWIAANFWILVGSALALYLARHYPDNPL